MQRNQLALALAHSAVDCWWLECRRWWPASSRTVPASRRSQATVRESRASRRRAACSDARRKYPASLSPSVRWSILDRGRKWRRPTATCRDRRAECLEAAAETAASAWALQPSLYVQQTTALIFLDMQYIRALSHWKLSSKLISKFMWICSFRKKNFLCKRSTLEKNKFWNLIS